MHVRPTGGTQSSVSSTARLGLGGKLNGGHTGVHSAEQRYDRKLGQDDEARLHGTHASAGCPPLPTKDEAPNFRPYFVIKS